MCVRVLFVYIILSLPVCIFNLSPFIEVFEVMMLTVLVMWSKELVMSPVRAWVIWEFHQTFLVVQIAVYPMKEIYHEWSAKMMNPSSRLITSPQVWICNESSVSGGKTVTGNLRVSIRIWQSDFSSQWLQVKKKGERMEILVWRLRWVCSQIWGFWKSWKPGKGWQSVQSGWIQFNTKLFYSVKEKAWLLDKTKSVKSNYRKV